MHQHAEAYRSGHNEAVLKTVWVQAHGGSNPSASAKLNLIRTTYQVFGLLFYYFLLLLHCVKPHIVAYILLNYRNNSISILI